jgi:hypothetical protein
LAQAHGADRADPAGVGADQGKGPFAGREAVVHPALHFPAGLPLLMSEGVFARQGPLGGRETGVGGIMGHGIGFLR